MSKKIATYLNLQNPQLYTGHSFRRTSATLLASCGGNILQLKQHGGWKSSNVAEGYIEDSLTNKKKIASMLQGLSTSPYATTSSRNPEAVFDVSQTPSTSTGQLSTSTTEDTVSNSVINSVNNTVINLPTDLSNSSSFNKAKPVINMTCHNCTINYNFYK